jgi:hypothetical protein
MNLPARYLATCTYCNASAVLRSNTTGDQLAMWIDGHNHPAGCIVVRLIQRLPAAA